MKRSLIYLLSALIPILVSIGCTSIKGGKARLVRTRTIEQPDTDHPDKVRREVITEEAEGRGASMSAFKWGSAPEVDASSPNVSLDDGVAASGGSFGLTTLTDFSQGGTVLFWIGGLSLIAGLILIVGFGLPAWGAPVSIGGALCIAAGIVADQFAWVILVALGVGLVVLIWFIYRAYTSSETEGAFGTVVQAIEDAPAQVRAAVKKYVRSEAEKGNKKDKVRKQVDRVKKRKDL